MTDFMRDRTRRIVRVLSGILVLNLVVAGVKLAFGLRLGALALTADGLHALLDASANVVGLLGMAVARKPPDANHPYGHRKFEAFAALAIAAMLFYACVEIARSAYGRLQSPQVPDVTPIALAAVLGTAVINLFVVWIERREGRKLNSELLLADAAHTGSDLFATLLVLVSFAASGAGIAWADPVATIVILVLIARAGIEILRGTLSTLSDERRIPPHEVEAVVVEEPGVREVHNIRSRGTWDDIHLDLHVLVDPETSIADAHETGHRVEERLRARWPGLWDIVVHVEPAFESERADRREDGGLRAER